VETGRNTLQLTYFMAHGVQRSSISQAYDWSRADFPLFRALRTTYTMPISYTVTPDIL